MSSCLVSLRDHKGRYLRSDNTDNLVFTEEGDAFRLARLGANTVCLQHEHGTWLTLEAEQLSLGSQPVPLELYVNLEKRKRVSTSQAGSSTYCQVLFMHGSPNLPSYLPFCLQL